MRFYFDQDAKMLNEITDDVAPELIVDSEGGEIARAQAYVGVLSTFVDCTDVLRKMPEFMHIRELVNSQFAFSGDARCFSLQA